MPKSWREVTADPRFEALSMADKAAAQREYFEKVLAPGAAERGLDPDSIWKDFSTRFIYPVKPESPNPLGLPSGPSFGSRGEQRAAEIRGEVPDPEKPGFLEGIGEGLRRAPAAFGASLRQHLERADQEMERKRSLAKWWDGLSEKDKKRLIAGLDSPKSGATYAMAEMAREASRASREFIDGKPIIADTPLSGYSSGINRTALTLLDKVLPQEAPPAEGGMASHLVGKAAEFAGGFTPGDVAAMSLGGGIGANVGRGLKVGGTAGRVVERAAAGAGAMTGYGLASGSPDPGIDALMGTAFGLGGAVPTRLGKLVAEYGIFAAVESLQKGRIPGMEGGDVDSRLLAEDLLEPAVKMLALHATNPSALTNALTKPRAARTPAEAEAVANAAQGVPSATAGLQMRQARLYREGEAAGWPVVTDRPEPVERPRTSLLPKLLPARAESQLGKDPAPILMGEPQVDQPATSRLRVSGMEGQQGAEPGTTRPVAEEPLPELSPKTQELGVEPAAKTEPTGGSSFQDLMREGNEISDMAEIIREEQRWTKAVTTAGSEVVLPNGEIGTVVEPVKDPLAADKRGRGQMALVDGPYTDEHGDTYTGRRWYEAGKLEASPPKTEPSKASPPEGPIPPEASPVAGEAAKPAPTPADRSTFISATAVSKVERRQGERGEESFATVSHPEGGSLEVRAEGKPLKSAKSWGVWDATKKAWLATGQTFAKAVKFAKETLADNSGFLLIRPGKKEPAAGPVKAWQAKPESPIQRVQALRREMRDVPKREADEVIGMELGLRDQPFKPAGPVRKAIQPLGSRIRRISGDLGRSYDDMEVRLAERVRDGQKLAVAYAKGRKGVDENGRKELKGALLSGLAEGQQVADRHGVGKEYAAVRGYLEDIHRRAVAVGVPKLGYLENYWPRVVEKPSDLDAFLREKQPEAWGEIQSSIAKEQDRLGRDLTGAEREGVITDFLLQYQPPAGSGRPGFAKERKIDWIDEALEKFYKDEHESFARYVQTMETEIAKREWLGGKGSDPIAEVVDQLLRDGQISDAQQKELRELLRSRFALHGTNQFVRGVKSGVYLGYIGQFKSVLTQLKDQAIAMYEAGLLDPRVRLGGAGYYGKALLSRKSRITIDEMAMQDIIADEIGSEGWSEKSLRRTLKVTGFTKLDKFGKETMGNAFANRVVDEIRRGKLTAQTKRELEYHLGKDYLQSDAYAKLKAGDRQAITRLASKMVRSWHPVDKSGTPQPMLDNPSLLGLAYQLKTFQLRQLDAVRRETLGQIAEGQRAGDKRKVAEGFVSLARIGTLMILAGGTVDTVKDFLYGRPIQLDDKVWDNLLQIIGLSKFAIYAARREGPAEAAFQQTIDPAVRKQATDAWMDGSRIVKKLRDGEAVELQDIKSIRYLPGVGDWLYWHRIPGTEQQGRGREMAQKQEGIQLNPLYKGDAPIAALERAKEMLRKPKADDLDEFERLLEEALDGKAINGKRRLEMRREFSRKLAKEE